MSHFAKYHEEWLNHHGKRIKVDGLTYRIDVRTWERVYPTSESVISVHLVPVSKRSKYYQEVRRKLGDDWSTCVLDSDVSFECKVLRLARKAGLARKVS